MSDDPTPADRRRTAMARLEILDAIAAAIDQRQEVLAAVADAADVDQARVALEATFGWSEVQAHAVLNLQLFRFTLRMRERIEDERASLRSEEHIE